MRYTKVYPTTGIITLDAAPYGISQEVLDTTIRNSKPIKAAVERLKEYEDMDEVSKDSQKHEKPVIDGTLKMAIAVMALITLLVGFGIYMIFHDALEVNDKYTLFAAISWSFMIVSIMTETFIIIICELGRDK